MDTLKTLEFDKIIQKVAAEAVVPAAAEALFKTVPATDADTAGRLLAETSAARDLSARRGAPPIAPIGKIYPVLKRSRVGAVLSPAELLAAASVLRITHGLCRYADGLTENHRALLPVFCRLSEAHDTERAISEAILDENTVDSAASPALGAIRRKIASTTESIHSILDEIIRSQTYQKVLMEQLVTMRDGRYVVPVRAEQRSSLPGVVHDVSQTGSTLFVEPMRVVEANNLLHRLAAEEKEEIERILAALSALVRADADKIEENYRAIVALDIIFARARYGDRIGGVCPSLRTDGSICLIRAHHPLLPQKSAVPIDISIGEAFDTLVITGPNTGGKTVSLKTLGLLTLMAAAGLHIPAADGSAVSVFSHVFADIGDEQSIEQSLSTFSSHLVNIIEILQKADRNTLALFDELGAGTDPGEGAALATAILQEMRARGVKTAATTHYSEIKLYALETEGVENAACEFDVETLRPTYRLIIGALGQSNAFAIARRLGMPESVLAGAHTLLSAENTKFEDVVRSLEESRRTMEADREAAHADRETIRKLRRALDEDSEKTEEKRKKILDDARREARQLLARTKAEIDESIKEARAAENKRAALEKARTSVSKKLDKVSGELSDIAARPAGTNLKSEDIREGMAVLLDSMAQRGTVTRLPDKDGNLEVSVGNIRIRTHISAISSAPPEKKVRTVATAHRHTAPVKTEIDLRGMTLDEALLVTEKFLDDAVLSHLETVTIIHGKGTGTLRSGIHHLLKNTRAVREYRLGKYGEGEDGVTIVTL